MTLLSVTLLTLDAKNTPVLGSVRAGLVRVLEPVQSGLHSAATPFRNAWGGMTGYSALQDENARLRSELAAKEREQLRQKDAVDQVEALKAQLDIPFVSEYPTVAAQIATGNYSSFDDNTAQIDKGSSQGIRAGMPVVNAGGVVGRIVKVTERRSIIQLISDPDLRLGIRLSNDSLGVGRGTGPGRPFVVDSGIGLNVPVKRGDPVMTSGHQRAIMPRDLPIGTVAKVTRVQSNQSQILEVTPAVDFSRLDYVHVVLWEPEP